MDKGSIVLYPGDIFFTRGTGLISRAIRVCTRTIGESRTRVNHTGLIVTQARACSALCVEALTTVKEHAFWHYSGTSDHVSVYRCTELSDVQREQIAGKAREYTGRTYGFGKIAAHLADWVLCGAYVFRRLTDSDRYPICSWVVAHSYGKLGLHFGVKPGAATPDDIYDFVVEKHPEKYEEIITLGPLGL